MSLNFGELLRGDRILISDYQLVMGKDVNCLELCTAHVAPEGVLWAKNLVSENYMVEWSVACICFCLLPDKSNSTIKGLLIICLALQASLKEMRVQECTPQASSWAR